MCNEDTSDMKDVPIGNDNFRKIRENDGYYVDKTELIKDILSKRNTDVFLFTRPRRFGKSLNISMLDAFFNLRYKGNKWFDGLKIQDDEESMTQVNDNPVISITMKDLDDNSFNVFLDDFRLKIQEVCRSYEYLRRWDTESGLKQSFVDLYDGKVGLSGLKRSLRDISCALEEYHGKKVIILIDEYDDPMNRTFGKNIQKDVIAFMRDLMSNALKTNPALRFGVVTGVMQIAKESIFSGLNNLYVNNVMSNDFSEYFGFTESEVVDMLDFYGHPEKMDEVREWYDGYRFGSHDIYNPWSLLNYIAKGFIPDSYWAGTSGNSIIESLVDVADDETMDDLRALASGGAVVTGMRSDMVYSDIEGNPDLAYPVMVMSGYLNARMDDDGCHLSIPNKEVYSVYRDAILPKERGSIYTKDIRNLYNAMKGNDDESIRIHLNDLIKDVLSARILDNEHVYQAFLIGMMMGFCGNYRIYGDTRETGEGYADIIFERISGTGPNMIVEMKRSADEGALKKDAELALMQIHSKDYVHGIDGKVLLYGISFFKKSSYIISEVYGQ